MPSTSRLVSNGQWQLIERDGFSLRVDPQRQSPLAFALSIAQGLDARPRRLDASYLYDAAGSALFDRITEQPEYYLTRTEDRLLRAHAAEIREAAGAGTLVELGSGASSKTQRLLDAWSLAGPTSYVLPAADFSLSLVAQHEAQHQDTILQAIALREDLEYRPAFASKALVRPAARPATERVLIPGGPFSMGTNDREWAYDNERPAHEVDVRSFWLGRAPVTNRQFLAFMSDGGYASSKFWSVAGWAWLAETNHVAPAHWRRIGTGAGSSLHDWCALVFGRLEPLDPEAIVTFPYREYSQVFFGQKYRVLQGSAFATRAVLARNSFRNWDLPERRQIFAGFRCAWPA